MVKRGLGVVEFVQVRIASGLFSSPPARPQLALSSPPAHTQARRERHRLPRLHAPHLPNVCLFQPVAHRRWNHPDKRGVGGAISPEGHTPKTKSTVSTRDAQLCVSSR